MDNNNAVSAGGIAIALSGGGIRATVFHLGVLQRLAKAGQLESINRLSTVSGGSLAIGLVMSTNGCCWPSSQTFIDSCIPTIRKLITSRDLQRSVIFRSLYKPWRLLRGRGAALAEALASTWGITQSLQDLPEKPIWFINATNYYTGKNWRFSRHRMGDWRSGYVDAPNIPVSVALAASAGVPYVIGTTRIRLPVNGWYRQAPGTEQRRPMPEPVEQVVRLWDGGVYENLGIEALYKIGNGFVSPDTRFLLVCDAAQQLVEGSHNVKGPIYFEKFLPRFSINVRTLDIMTDQNRSLRSRFVVSEMQSGRLLGSYVRIGNTAAQIVEQANKYLTQPLSYSVETISSDVVSTLAKCPTVLSRINKGLFDQLIAHGYEATDATLGSYHHDRFSFLPQRSGRQAPLTETGEVAGD